MPVGVGGGVVVVFVVSPLMRFSHFLPVNCTGDSDWLPDGNELLQHVLS